MKWVKCNSIEDIPRREFLMTYILKEDLTGELNISNLYAENGFLSWSDDFSYGSVISDGEIVHLTEIALFIELPIIDLGDL